MLRFVLLLWVLMSSLSALELEQTKSEFTHEPEFSCTELWEAEGVSVEVKCQKGIWSRAIKAKGWTNKFADYAEHSGPSTGGIAKLFYLDVDKDGVQELAAMLYNGLGNGEAVRYNEVVYWFKDGREHRLRIKDVHESRMAEYYQESLPEFVFAVPVLRKDMKERYLEIEGATAAEKDENAGDTYYLGAVAYMKEFRLNMKFIKLCRAVYAQLDDEGKSLFLKAHLAWKKSMLLKAELANHPREGSGHSLMLMATERELMERQMRFYQGLLDGKTTWKSMDWL